MAPSRRDRQRDIEIDRERQSNAEGSTDRTVRLRTAALQRLLLFDKKPSAVSAPPAHLSTLRRAESRCQLRHTRTDHAASNRDRVKHYRATRCEGQQQAGRRCDRHSRTKGRKNSSRPLSYYQAARRQRATTACASALRQASASKHRAAARRGGGGAGTRGQAAAVDCRCRCSEKLRRARVRRRRRRQQGATTWPWLGVV